MADTTKTVEQFQEEQTTLLRERNRLLNRQNAISNSIDQREYMRGVARRWDALHPIGWLFFRNPYDKWK